MPTYHYRCKNCGYDFTRMQSFSDEPVTLCPECHEEQVHKVYSVAGVTFKGPAFIILIAVRELLLNHQVLLFNSAYFI